MYVREAMSGDVFTVGPAHTLRVVAQMMSARGIGAAAVIDEQQAGPGIITERDILHSVGRGEVPDEERVSEHLTADVILAAPDWRLEQAAAEMIRGGFRHVIVVDGPAVVGILSMRDIVRSWTAELVTAGAAVA